MHKTWPLVFVSFAAGIWLAGVEAWLLLIAALILLLIAAAIFPEFCPKSLGVIIVMGAGIGYCHLMAFPPPIQLPALNNAEISGVIQDIPYYDGDKTTFILKTDLASPYQKRIRVVCLGQCQFNRGDLVKLRGDLKTPNSPGNPGEFDYPAYLAHQGVYYNLTVKKVNQSALLKPVAGPLKWIGLFRSQAEQVTRQALTQDEAAVLLGMLLGGRAGMEEEQYSDFQKTGIVHLFSVGGLHVGFLLILVAWLTSLMKLGARGKFWGGVLILLIYGTLVAWPAPVIRAVIMGILGLLAYYSGRENSLLNALSISGLVILLISPDNLFSLSFQLTILASWGLIYLFPLVRNRLPYKNWVGDMILIPVCAELAVLPLVAYYFNLFTPVSILTNILITWLAGGAVILGFMAFLLAALIPALATLILYPAGLGIELILLIVQWTKQIPGAYIWVATPAVGMVVLYFAAVFTGILALSKPSWQIYGAAATLMLTVFITSLLLPARCYDRGHLEMICIDVGQGDATLLKTPQGKFILVDGGGSKFYDVGAKKLLPYLHYRGIRRLDMIISTHPDIDHMKGLENVAAELEVDCLALPDSIADREEYRELRAIADRRGIPVYTISTGDQLALEEGIEMKVLHPENRPYRGEDMNAQSVVLQVTYRDFSALLTGDIPKAIMATVLEKIELPLDVWHVPHHGSRGSLLPGFYPKLHPRWALISVGENNTFGHPNQEVLDALTQADIQILRTDQDGAVMMRTDGREILITRTKKQQ
ncbi:MAG: DNA internalization-related competence protein ComEC/Rec2 [Syntrophomonadaceae bacterium]|nr:DNA internalization-related competence protein ComEC/Rec2 [Syntrophomonadaceae bacterium]